MSTFAIIAIVTIGLFVLVGVAITLQTIEKNNKEKRRLEAALNSRARNFHYMLDSFPDNFLNRDLQVLVCKCLLEVYEQLTRGAPSTQKYKTQFQRTQERLNAFKSKPDNTTPVRLSDPAQIKDVQKLLTSLHGFISKLMASKRINTAEAKAYSKQINRLMVQTSLDNVNRVIQEAMQSNKLKLALHYHNVAIGKMQKENSDGFYSTQITSYQETVSKLEKQLGIDEQESQRRRAEADAEWDQLDKPDDSWKKNAVYD